MKITYRIPQKDQYSYIEVELEGDGTNKPDSYETIKELFENDRGEV